MAAPSTLTMHAYMDELMRQLGCENLKEMSRRTGIAYTTLRDWAFEGGFMTCEVRQARRLAGATGRSIDELVSGFDSKPAT